jgi:hypothetical protein
LRSRRRPCLEALEERWCLSVTATLSGGTLTISGDSSNLQVTRTAAGTFTVLDTISKARSVQTFSGVKRLDVDLGNGNDRTHIDLGGGTLTGGVSVSMGRGKDSLAIVNGTIQKKLSVRAGPGNDSVALDGLTVGTATSVDLGGGAGNTLVISGGTTLRGSLDAFHVNLFTLDAGSSVLGNVHVVGGRAANTVTIAGHVGHDLVFAGGDRGDTVTVVGTASIGGSAFLVTGGGDDTVTFGGTVGVGDKGYLFIDTGGGADQVTFTSSALVHGDATVLLGPGNDTFGFGGKVTGMLFCDGGPGFDAFVNEGGSAGKLVRSGFELILPILDPMGPIKSH